MVQFEISAPNSLSVFGEYSNNILRTSIDLRTTLNFQEMFSVSNDIEINFPQLHLVHKMSFQKFLKFYTICVKNMKILHEQVQQFISIAQIKYSYHSDNQKVFLQKFYYLLVRIMYEEQLKIKQFRINVSTKLIIHKKFFCLTSLKVCLAACLLHWTRLQKGIQNTFHDTDLKKIYTYATGCENTVSLLDIDTMVCIYGSMIQYKTEWDMCKALNLPNMKILLVDSKRTQDIEAQEQQVKELMWIFPDITSSILRNIDNVTNMAAAIFEKMLDTYNDNELNTKIKHDCFLKQYGALEFYTFLNQRLLRMLNVSHYHLDEICTMAQKHGLAGKYTNLDNGRYAYIWCPLNINIDVASFINELNKRGFEVTVINLLCTGVKVE